MERDRQRGTYAEQLEESLAALKGMTARVSEEEQNVSSIRRELYCAREQAELERLRAIADVNQRWEEREARLVRRLEELELEAKTEGSTRVGDSDISGERTVVDRRYVTIVTPVVHGGNETPTRTDSSGDKPTTPAPETDNQAQLGDGGGPSPVNAPTIVPGIAQPITVGNPAVVVPPSVNTVPCPSSRVASAGCVQGTLNANASAFKPIQSETGSAHTQGQALLGSQRAENGVAVVPVPTLAATPLDSLLTALLAQQLPSLPNFSGENVDNDGESFSEWIERLELVANVARWSDQTKLVNVATRLRGLASRFYRSCPPQQRSSYAEFTAALRKRFTPVRLQSVQSSLFHECKQKRSPTEAVDTYAQELRKLFHRAYPTAQQEEGGMGENVLAYQFVAGLIDPLKAKLVGTKGTFDELLTKARFEEARMKERGKSSSYHTTATDPISRNTTPRNGMKTTQHKLDRRCFSCGGTGHLARECSLQGRGAPVESRGRGSGSARGAGRSSQNHSRFGGTGGNTQVSMLQVEVGSGTEETIDATEPGSEQEHRVMPTDNRSQEVMTTNSNHDVIAEAVTQVMATMYGVKASRHAATLGPTPTAGVLLDDVPVSALLDTGSPVSIVSLEFFLKAAAEKRTSGQTPVEWGKAVQQRLQPTTVSLRSYGGNELKSISQVRCRIARGNRAVNTVLQVQEAAPVDLLLGTDVIPQLGFALIQVGEKASEDLLGHLPPHSEMSGSCVPAQETAALPDGEPTTSDLILPIPTTPQGEAPSALVRLIQATKLPGRHSKLIQADVHIQTTETTLLFQSDQEILGAKGVKCGGCCCHTREDSYTPHK